MIWRSWTLRNWLSMGNGGPFEARKNCAGQNGVLQFGFTSMDGKVTYLYLVGNGGDYCLYSSYYGSFSHSLLNTSKMNVNGYGPVWVKFWATWKHGVCFLIQSKILWLAKIDPSYPNGFVKQCDISELVKLVARSSCLIPQVGHANLSFSWFPKVPLTGAHLHTRQWWPQDVHCWIQLPLTNGLRSRHLSGLYLKRFHKPITIKGCVGR